MYKRAVHVLPFILFGYFVVLVIMIGSTLRPSNDVERHKPQDQKIVFNDDEMEVETLKTETSSTLTRRIVKVERFFNDNQSSSEEGKYEHPLNPEIPLSGDLFAPKPGFRHGQLARDPNVIIGVPTVKRENASYLLNTLQSLLAADQLEKHPGLRVVVYIGDVNMLNVLKTASQIADKFPAQLSDGKIEVISPPSRYFPNWNETIIPGFGDSFERTKWRSKQNLDQIFLMLYIYNLRPDYYLMVEDDVIASKDYASKIMHFAEKNKRSDWFYLSFSSLGAIGKLFRVNTLPSYASFIHTFWNKKPLDWLQEDYVRTMVCSYDESEQLCAQRKKLMVIPHSPSLFQHMGKVSSLKGKVQPLRDTHFRG